MEIVIFRTFRYKEFPLKFDSVKLIQWWPRKNRLSIKPTSIDQETI